MSIAINLPQSQQASLLALKLFHDTLTDDSHRALVDQALAMDHVPMSVAPVLDCVARQHIAANKGVAVGAPGPIIQVLLADLQSLFTNPAIQAWLLSLLTNLIHIPTPTPAPVSTSVASGA